MLAVTHHACFRRQRTDFAGTQKFNGGTQADHAVFPPGIGRCAEGHIGQGKDGSAMRNPHAVLMVLGQGHAYPGIAPVGAFNGHLQVAHQSVVRGNIVFHNILHWFKKEGRKLPLPAPNR